MYSYRLKCRDYPCPILNIGYISYNLNNDNDDINKKINNVKKRYNKNHIRMARNDYLSTKIYSILHQYKTDLMANVACNSLQNKITIKQTKHSIDKYYMDFSWDKMKLYTNPYEFIFLSSNKFLQNKTSSVAKIEPLSRSFFKMVEISNNYFKTEINIEVPIRSLHLAEGPGGFIEGLLYLRKKNVLPDIQQKDIHYGITLLDKAYEVPSWKKSGQFMKDNPNVNILTGIDGKGDLCNPDNLWYLYNRFKINKMDIITGDGGFDFSVDYNLQEYIAFPLILSQCIAGMLCLKKGGKFMCKIFDMNNMITVELLYILQCHFEEIIFFKPNTSRLANSEKYIVCTGFKGIEDHLVTDLINIIKTWNTLNTDTTTTINNYINNKLNNTNTNTNTDIKIINWLFLGYIVYGEDETIITNQKIPNSFFQYINKINTEIIEKQTENIKFTIDNIENYNKNIITRCWFDDCQKKQIANAKQWCKTNNIPY